jgi:hypothetical protein
VPRFNRSLRSIQLVRNNHCHRKSAVISAKLKVHCEHTNHHRLSNRRNRTGGKSLVVVHCTGCDLTWAMKKTHDSHSADFPGRDERANWEDCDGEGADPVASVKTDETGCRSLCELYPEGHVMRSATDGRRRHDHWRRMVERIGGVLFRSRGEQAPFGHNLVLVHLLQDQAAGRHDLLSGCETGVAN